MKNQKKKMKMKMIIEMRMKMKMKMMMKQLIKTKKNKIIKELNDHLDEIIDKSKSFEDQIKSLKKLQGLEECYPYTIMMIKS